jgi:hypothetical protein
MLQGQDIISKSPKCGAFSKEENVIDTDDS